MVAGRASAPFSAAPWSVPGVFRRHYYWRCPLPEALKNQGQRDVMEVFVMGEIELQTGMADGETRWLKWNAF